jgi:CDP-diacylglycerol pyrophosphatase
VSWKTDLAVRLAAALAFVALAVAPAACADPDTLWKIVHGQCTPNEAAKADPSPCVAVDLAGGYAVLKDRSGATQVLVIPTAKVTGIEDPAVLGAKAPNYWLDAWEARSFVEGFAKGKLPRDDIALAVNSIDGRSQNQLHIHVDCIQPAVRAALRAAEPTIGPTWTPVDVGVPGRHYQGLTLAAADLATHNPFDLLADGDPAAKADMGLETLVLAPVTFADGAPGFILLSDRADPTHGDYGSGEELMDHGCKVLTQPPS